MLVPLAGCGSSSFLPAVCVTAPGSVAAGPAGSFYIDEKSGLVRFSSTGKVLGRFHVGASDWAVGPSGDVFYAVHSHIVEASSTGTPVRRWAAGTMQPEAVAKNGDVYAYEGGVLDAGEGVSIMERFSPAGRLLKRWRTSYGPPMVVGRHGFIYSLNGQNSFTELNPTTLNLVATITEANYQFNALTVTAGGTVYVGGTGPGDVPFVIQKMTLRGRAYNLSTINSDEESVGSLAVGSNGTVYVVRDSYDEPGPADSGLFALSGSGSPKGKFAFCKHH